MGDEGGAAVAGVRGGGRRCARGSRRSARARAGAAVIAAACLVAPGQAAAGQPRPLVPQLDAQAIRERCGTRLAAVEKRFRALAALRASDRDFLRAWNAAQIAFEDFLLPVALHRAVSPDREVREAAEWCIPQWTRAANALYQDGALFERVAALRPRGAIEKRLQEQLIEHFEDGGVALAAERRTRVREILDRLQLVAQQFERNLRENASRVDFDLEELRGVPEQALAAAAKNGDGRLSFALSEPEYRSVMATAEDERARARFYLAWVNRGTPRNLELMREAMRLRRELAALHDQPSFAHLAIRRRMAQTPEAVERLLDEVASRVHDVERRELDELRAEKARWLSQSATETSIVHWDVAFLRERVRRARFDVDAEHLRRHFPLDASIDWSIDVASELYGLDFRRVELDAWHPSVRYYDVRDRRTRRFLGGVYIDVLARPGKRSGAFAFPVRAASTARGRTPISVLVANLGSRGLTPRELTTLLHEFGHVLHAVLSEARYAELAGTRVERDFVEAPSQMFEEWTRDAATLARLSRFCSGCPPVDAELAARIRDAERFGVGMLYAGQQVLARFDLAIHGRDADDADPLGIWQSLEAATPLGYAAGSEFPGVFQHVMSGYAAGYYGYMWSKVIALDMASEFRGRLLDRRIGQRFRRTVLAQGGQRPAGDMVASFLGRAPSPEAFFAYITGSD